MESDTLGLLVAAAAGVVIAVPKIVDAFRGRPSRRDSIRKDVELLGLLPPGNTTGTELAEFIDRQIRDLIEAETEKRRDPVGIGVAVVLITISLWLVVAVATSGTSGWWLVVAVPLLILGVVGFIQDAVPRRRDEQDRLIRDDGHPGGDAPTTS